METSQKTIVILFDGLGAKFLDPYGLSDFRHPAINRLAAESILFENLIANSVHSDVVTRSFFGPMDNAAENTVFHFAQQRGKKSELILDAGVLRSSYPVKEIDQITVVEQKECLSIAKAFEETELAQVFAQVIDLVNQSKADFISVHCSSLMRTWDAPINERLSGVGDEDPDLDPFFVAPEKNESWRNDPDQYLQWLTAYQAQVRVLDQCLEILLSEFVSNHPDATIVFSATGGYALGEHGYVGARADTPFIEVAHLPLLVRMPMANVAAIRNRRMIEPSSVYELLINCLSNGDLPEWAREVRIDQNAGDSCVFSHGKNGSVSIRTKYWSFVNHNQQHALYVRPDDLWEINNVIDRCPDVASAMIELKDTIAKGGQLENLPELIFESAE